MIKEAIIFTVFTPSYNRSGVLHRVYDSLLKQTFKNFEWLIVDDGSIDNTSQLVSSWIENPETLFTIRYIWQENAGKKTAFNLGVKEAKGELFLPWDSDDKAVPEALESFYRYWQSIPSDLRNDYFSVCGLCVDQNGVLIGDMFPSDIFDSNSLEVIHKYRIGGEKWGFARTDILRKFPFPEDVSGYVPEGLVWSRISRYYKTRFVNDCLRIYYLNSENSVVDNSYKSPDKYAHGRAIWAQEALENQINWFWYNPLWFLKTAADFTRCSLHLLNQKQNVSYPLRNLHARLLYSLMWPLGFFLYIRDRRQLIA
jgi:glycosyltransferase involved in cell wall biosynthesis